LILHACNKEREKSYYWKNYQKAEIPIGLLHNADLTAAEVKEFEYKRRGAALQLHVLINNAIGGGPVKRSQGARSKQDGKLNPVLRLIIFHFLPLTQNC